MLQVSVSGEGEKESRQALEVFKIVAKILEVKKIVGEVKVAADTDDWGRVNLESRVCQ